MYTYGYLFYIPINVIYVSIFAIKGILKKRKKEYYFFILIFGIYLNFFIEKAFFPIFTDGASYYVTLSNYINLDITNLFQYTPYQIIGNLLLTFPLGILMAFIIDSNNSVRIGISVLFSALIEFIQLSMIFSLHLIDVFFDINDIILNVVGCLLGNFLFYIFCKIYIHIQNSQCRNSVIRYFYQVCYNCANHKSSLYGTDLIQWYETVTIVLG